MDPSTLQLIEKGYRSGRSGGEPREVQSEVTVARSGVEVEERLSGSRLLLMVASEILPLCLLAGPGISNPGRW